MRISSVSKVLLATTSLFASFLKTTCNDDGKEKALHAMKYVSTKQYRANDPIQDRICVSELDRIKGLVVGVFDGHGGDLCAEYASANLPRFLNDRIKNNFSTTNSIKQNLQKSLSQCFDDLQNGFKAVFLQNITNLEYQRVGACALVAIITPRHITVANAGDCEGVVLGGEKPVKINQRLNAGEPSEQQRLRKQFPDQPDIVKCIKNTNYCYVKGRLQPTRSLGDFYLKESQFNFTNLGVFTKSYITHKPKITSFNLNHALGKTLVVATDGLWDQLDENDMEQTLKNHHGTKDTADILYNKAIQKIMERNKFSSFEALDRVQNRRNLHDDISIVTVDLDHFQKQYQFQWKLPGII